MRLVHDWRGVTEWLLCVLASKGAGLPVQVTIPALSRQQTLIKRKVIVVYANKK